MMSGSLYWVNGNLSYRGTDGFFWASTPYTYTNSHVLYFNSAGVYPKNGYNKPYGFSLRCIAFQSSPQPSSFGYDVGQLQLVQW